MHLISSISNNLIGVANQQTACAPLQNKLPVTPYVRLAPFAQSTERPYFEEES